MVFLIAMLPTCGGGDQQRAAGPSRTLLSRFGLERIRSYRTDRGLSQEDMISHGFSGRRWQMIEARRPTTVTLLRVQDAVQVPLDRLIARLHQHLRKGRRQSVGVGPAASERKLFFRGAIRREPERTQSVKPNV